MKRGTRVINSIHLTNIQSYKVKMCKEKMHIYYTTIDVQFKKPLHLIDDKKRLRKTFLLGFMQEFGCTAETIEHMKGCIVASLDRSDVKNANVVFESVFEIKENEIENEIYGDKDIGDALQGDPRKCGVWYKTGRAFYYPDKPKWLAYSLMGITLVAIALVSFFLMRKIL